MKYPHYIYSSSYHPLRYSQLPLRGLVKFSGQRQVYVAAAVCFELCCEFAAAFQELAAACLGVRHSTAWDLISTCTCSPADCVLVLGWR